MITGVPHEAVSLEDVLETFSQLADAAAGQTSAAVTAAALLLAHQAVTGRVLRPADIRLLAQEGSDWLFGWVPIVPGQAS